jgi:hypothetical protein
MTSAIGKTPSAASGPVKLNPGQLATIAAEALGVRIGPAERDHPLLPVPGAFTNDERVAVAVAIAMGESGGNINAHNSSGPDDSYGLWQINMKGTLGPTRRAQFGLANNEQLFDPRTNAKAMAKISLGGRYWSAWSIYTSGKYKAYLPQAREAVKNPEAWATGQGEVNVIPGGKLFDAFNGIIDGLKKWFGEGLLRIAGFLAGAILIILAVVMYIKSVNVRGAVKTVAKATVKGK